MQAVYHFLFSSPLIVFFEMVLVCVAIFWLLLKFKKRTWGRPIARFFASLKLAVLIILGIGIISAVGTIVEARYNVETAQRAVYQTVWMWGILGLLCVNLIGVMADRWPWKVRHTGFILAHIGIIITLIGSVLTYTHGIDGSMRFAIGQTNSQVILTPKDLVVWATYDGNSYVKIFEQEIDFFDHDLGRDPVKIPIDQNEIAFTEFIPFAAGSSKIKADANTNAGPAVRFQLDNTHVSVNEWLWIKPGQQAVEHEFGPARVMLSNERPRPSGRNEILLVPVDVDTLEYAIHYKDESKKPVYGKAKQGDVIETGWMGLRFRLIRYIRHAAEVWDFESKEYPNQTTTEAVRMRFQDQLHWLQLNSVVKLFTDNAAYIVSYGNRRMDLKVPIRLERFKVGRYQGTMRAASYASDVYVEGLGAVNISMNEPLKHKGYTFYQASFEEDERGQPTHSILSVNFDPGRGLKYLGSLLIVLGSMFLFWWKRFGMKARQKKSGASSEVHSTQAVTQ